MAEKKIGIGVVGCGSSIWMHGPALISQENARVVAWMDPEEKAARAATGQYGGETFTDFDRLLACRDVDALIIASPTWMHLPQCRQAAAAGKHVLCEKPMARDITECRQMAEACRIAGVTLMMGFMKRFNPAFIKAKEMIDSGELGEVFEIGCDWAWPQYFLAGWRDTLRGGGGLLQDHGSHTVDLCRWWTGDVASVSAEVRVKLEGREVEDYALVTCRHKSGCVSTHRHTRLTHQTLHERYQIEGSKATLVLECVGQWSPSQTYTFTLKRYTSEEGVAGVCADILLQPQGGLDRQMREQYSYARQLRFFVDAIREGGEPGMCTAEDGLHAMEVVNAAYISSAENRTVVLPLEEGYDLAGVFRTLGKGTRFPPH
jgi:UDP-N-acetyl-2-amino-2-deoxyglucuronate dehydrogenase